MFPCKATSIIFKILTSLAPKMLAMNCRDETIISLMKMISSEEEY